MLIDCDDCAMQHTVACQDCVVTVILGLDGGPVEIADEEAAALDLLSQEGLVPRLRLVPRHPDRRAAG